MINIFPSIQLQTYIYLYSSKQCHQTHFHERMAHGRYILNGQFANSFVTSFNCIIFLNTDSQMDGIQGDWQGFETYNEDIRYNFTKATPQQSQQYPSQQNEKIDDKPALQKKLTFRSKNKRKSSFNNTFYNKKIPTQQLLQKSIPQKYIKIERSKKVHSIFQKKDEGIPIFRMASYPSYGDFLYKSTNFSTAQQYLSRYSQQKFIDRSFKNESCDLLFNSNFQSGNLQQVIKQNNEYHCYITVDTNTKGHKQWFYFTITSPSTKTVKIVIHSFKKKLSLFQIGMKPYAKFRDEEYQAWRPVGNNIRYYKNIEKYKKGTAYQRKQQYNLSFQIELQKDKEIAVASSIPYSYSFLQERLRLFTVPSCNKVQIKQGILCKAITGLTVPLLTVNQTAETNKPKYIIINARSHPGESSSSWVVDGILSELVNSTIVQNILTQFNIVLKIVPMLNVQGVYMGNYRTGIMGVDFNRLFLSGSPDLFPQIASLKKLVSQCKQKGKVDLYLDLHGHSILPGCFLYGPDPQYAPATSLKMLVKQMNKSKYFMKNHCVLGVDSTKVQTSRIYFQVQEGVYSLTCENSLGLFCRNGLKGRQTQFQSKNWQQFGKELINIILNIYDQYNEKDTGQKNYLIDALDLIEDAQQQEFRWQKSKTDNGFQQQIRQMKQFEVQQIDIPNKINHSQANLKQNNSSQNDSDNSSQNLSVGKQKELIKMVRQQINKNNSSMFSNSTINIKESIKQQSKMNENHSKGKFINNFKEYRFGIQDPTINDWYTRKRLFSIPKHLKTEKNAQSYLIRKKPTRSITQDQIAFEPAELMTKRVVTEQREQIRKSSLDRGNNQQFFNKQRLLLENLLMKKF